MSFSVILGLNKQFFNLSLVSMVTVVKGKVVTHNSRGYGLWVYENPILSYIVHIWLNYNN